MLTSFVVPTYRRPSALQLTLEALFELDHPASEFEVIVVDDGSGDDTISTVETISADRPNLKLLALANSGVARARNAGAEAAAGELLIFLDDDIIVAPDHVERHLAARAAHGDCRVNGHWEFSPATLEALEATPFGRFRIGVESWVKGETEKQPLPDGRLRPSTVTAANLSISKRLFVALGGFDATFPYAGCEDQEFAYRAAEADCAFIYDPAIRLLHNDGRLTERQFCERQRRGAITAVFLAARHPEAYAGRPLMTENAPLSRHDPLPRTLKKIVKSLYASAPGLWTVALVTHVLERMAPRSALLRKLYKMTVGAYIFRGIREGLEQMPDVRSAVQRAQVRAGHA
jgi:GT2 family glycosyltransferase